MTVSRRSLLQQGMVAALASLAGPLQAWSAQKNKSNNNSAENTGDPDRDAFTKAVGSAFKVSPTSGKGNAVWLRLLAVEDLPELVPVDPDTMDVPPTSTTSIETSGFMLKFLGTLDKPLTQDTYSFEHPDMGRFFLFIVPAGEQTYTATFNRLR